MRWSVLDAPLDSSGRGRGERRAPGALRTAGLLARLGAQDAGVLDTVINDPVRDPATGVIGADQLRRATRDISARITELTDAGDVHPLVLGGDCAILPGILHGLPAGFDLWFLDGHYDFHDGRSSPTGEAADMDLSMVTGHGPVGILDREGPLVDPDQVHLLGPRPPRDTESGVEAARVDRAIHLVPADQLRGSAAAEVGRTLAAATVCPVWLHLDLDVLDPLVLPAVSYPEPGGLDWADVVGLLTPLVRSGRLVGMSVADLNADEDPDGRHAERVVDVLAEVLAA
ncbi:arginase family protein [Micromonospora endolithica]|uniref:Arginase family protein n=1 Tax=Micromonospora endolithica TaxID=230091 RepID=A0A3A9ZJT1_9ACTN|nr:arginase family protein [Micromonospora endolithica]RKN48581.1 arginase family protein [Micromonospora endolithica]TWJ22090.1 arginase [Micromonospora endolithica]